MHTRGVHCADDIVMANFLYVDNSNVWIEGMHVAAVAQGLAPDLGSAHGRNICARDWTIDFGRE